MTTAVHLSSQLAGNVLDARAPLPALGALDVPSPLSAFGVPGAGVVTLAATGPPSGSLRPDDAPGTRAGIARTAWWAAAAKAARG
ncbi:hypothetical protein [Streptomyces mangrovisoli]|uniref:Uncharacterized protein n=1 Tax=Streptomyces mangrovisoli TaxID=1428628 RepID=A0A1J4NNN1_9ACTN|nr:hypothetical protein [Streptomyces mangrovisoli]OIJ63959.1 hypothetical protein WN71_031680 [Streptomyces mangrovisoli]